MVVDSIVEIVIPISYMRNIWADLTDVTVVKTREKRHERKRKRKKTKEVEKRAHAESILNKRDR